MRPRDRRIPDGEDDTATLEGRKLSGDAMEKETEGSRTYQTDEGLIIFKPIEQLFAPILRLLASGERPAWELEDELGMQFKLNERERRAKAGNGHRAWENHVAWALSHLTRQKRVTNLRSKRAPDGGRRGIYKANR